MVVAEYPCTPTLTSETVPLNPETLITDGYGDAGPAGFVIVIGA